MRRWFGVVFLGVLVGVLIRQIQVENDSQFDGQRGPYLQRLTATSVVIRWQTDSPVATQLQLGGLSVQGQSEPTTRHRIEMQHLNPSTVYEYQIAEHHYNFSTPPSVDDKNTPVRLWVLGDPGSDSELHQLNRQVAQQWLQQNKRPGQPARPLLDLWLTTGDNAYTSGRNLEYQQAIFEPYQDWLSQFALLPVIGNHDMRRRAYRRIFEFSQNGEQGGLASNSQHYYSVNQGPLHVVVLDSSWSVLHDRQAMLDWLKRDLQANIRPWVITIFHHPPYTKGSHDSDDTRGSDRRIGLIRKHVLPVLERHSVNLVLGGHSHVYERSHLLNGHYGQSISLKDSMILARGQGIGDDFQAKPGCQQNCGTVYQVLGSTAELRPGTVDHPAMAVGLNQSGTVIIDVKPECLHSRFLNSDGLVADEFVLGQPGYCLE